MAAKAPSKQSHLRLKSHYLRRFPNTVNCLGEWKRYRDGYWQRVEEGQVRKEMLETLVAYSNGLPITRNVLSSVYALTQADTFLPGDTFDSDIDLLAFNDRTLKISTGETRPNAPEDYVTSKLPFNYAPEIHSDLWQRVLASTEAEYVPFIQEYAGYCLTPSTRHELALWCWGDPGSGKSTFIAGLEAMLGARCCTLGLADIERSNFALAQIPGKTLAISTEQPSRFIRSSHILNSLISGESLSWERKFVDPITIRPHVKLVWAMNELPRIDSSGVGLFRRVVPIPWRKVEKPDPKVKDAVYGIGQAVFNWAFEGLKRLNERGHFDIPAGLIAEREAYRTQNDIPLVFVEDACLRCEVLDESGNYNKTQSAHLYHAYRNWCQSTGHKSLSSTAFAAEMKRLGFERVRIDGRSYFIGILLKPNGNDDAVIM